MNLSRLMILGLLSERGPMHGHQLRRTGELMNVEAWGGITGGALYRELHRLENEQLIRPLRDEQIGRRPARRVYEITEDGALELVVQRDAALQSLFDSADPVGVVLLFASGADLDDLRERLGERRRRVEHQLEALTAERSRLEGQGYLSVLAIGAFRRGELRLDAELRWHDEFDQRLSNRDVRDSSPQSAEIRSLPASSARRGSGA